MDQPTQDADEGQKDGLDARLAQANKLFQTGTLLIYGKRKSVDRAIKCVQRAIVLDNTNFKYWQLLGEAYYQRGSLNPAINSFMKSLDRAEQHLKEPQISDEELARIKADCIYNRLRMSDIRLSVLHLEESLQGYSDIIASDANNVAALTGLSRTKLQMARSCFSNGLVKSGHQHCMDALKYALKATCLAPHLCFTWKLASDCCLIQILFGQRGQFESTIDVLQYPGATDDGLVVDQVTCIELAQQFLCKALSIEQFKDSTSLWHNLGLSLYLKYKLLSGERSATKELEKSALLNKSLKCLLKALDSDRANSQVRNSIGLVSFHLNLLNTSQNFIIKSIQTNMSTSEMQFSNLGYIYLHRGEFRLASVVFNRSQAEEPLYCRSWLGNALISERNNSDNMTYLRHCHKLENNYEAQLMYATRVVSLPHVEESKDLINALDCMRRVINYNPLSLEGLNTLGLLLERCKFTDESKKCFETAYTLSPKDSRISINRLRQFRAAEIPRPEYLEAVEHMVNGSNLGCTLNFIHYLFRCGDYEAVNSRLTRFIEKLPQDNLGHKISAQILLAMADKMAGRDFKSWLFKNIIDSEEEVLTESVINLFCLMLFGSITSDQELVGQVSKDLMEYQIAYLSTKAQQFADIFYSLEGYWTRVSLFSSIFTNQAHLIRPLVALFPTIPDLWLYLGLSIMIKKSQLQIARSCIAKARLIGSTDPNLTSVCDILLAILSSDGEVEKIPRSEGNTSRLMNRSVHLSRAINKCPDTNLLWRCLLEPEKSKEAENEELLDFAVDHALRTIIVR